MATGNTYGMSGTFGLREAVDMRGVVIVKPDFTAIERFIKQNQESKMKVRAGMDLLIKYIALVTAGYAQQQSAGPIAPRQRSNPALAYRVPVQRITGHYFAAWSVKQVGLMHWRVQNSSREAYLIETGMYMRVRRPILKMSVIKMLRFLETTRTAQRFAASVIAPRRNALGQYAAIPFGQRLSGTTTLQGIDGGLAGPSGKLPG